MNNTTETKAKPTAGPAKVRFFRPDDPESDFFVEAPNVLMPELGYGIEILMDDYGDHNGYPREQRLADAHLLADAINVHHETGLTPRELVERYEEAIKALMSYHKYFYYKEENGGRGMGDFPHPKNKADEVIKKSKMFEPAFHCKCFRR